LLMAIYSLSLKSLNEGQNRAELTQNSRVIMERITRDIRESKSIATILPATKKEEGNPPKNEIELMDGHSEIMQYIKYFISGTDLKRQIKRYYFPSDTQTFVTFDAEDDFGNPPIEEIVSENLVGQYIKNVIFYGDNPFFIEMSVEKLSTTYNTKTSVYGRNL